MTCFRKAFACCAVSVGLVAAPDTARAQPLSDTEITFEADFDVLIAFGDSHLTDDRVFADFTVRFETETLSDNGWRFGLESQARLTSGDGRRGLSRAGLTGPFLNARPVAGLLTGLHGPAVLDEASPRIIADLADLYLQTRWFKVRAGLGETAADLERPVQLSVFSLSDIDDPIFDPTGLQLASTSLTLADSAPTVSIQSQRLLGVRVSASFAPDASPCAQSCHPSGADVARAELKSVWSFGASFDRRARSSGVRWQAALGYESADISGIYEGFFETPWVASLRLVRQAGDLTLTVSSLSGSDGYQGADYLSMSTSAAYERGNWLYGVQVSRGDSDLIDATSTSVQLAASRFVGENGVIGLGITHVGEDTGFAKNRNAFGVFVETGLRF